MRSNTKHRRMNDDHGFTLIELSVVVALLGLLVAIAFPIANKVQDTAYETTVRADLRNMAQQVQIVKQGGLDRFPLIVSTGGAPTEADTMLGSLLRVSHAEFESPFPTGAGADWDSVYGKPFYASNGEEFALWLTDRRTDKGFCYSSTYDRTFEYPAGGETPGQCLITLV